MASIFSDQTHTIVFARTQISSNFFFKVTHENPGPQYWKWIFRLYHFFYVEFLQLPNSRIVILFWKKLKTKNQLISFFVEPLFFCWYKVEVKNLTYSNCFWSQTQTDIFFFVQTQTHGYLFFFSAYFLKTGKLNSQTLFSPLSTWIIFIRMNSTVGYLFKGFVLLLRLTARFGDFFFSEKTKNF